MAGPSANDRWLAEHEQPAAGAVARTGAVALAGALFGVGLLFLASPRAGAAVFGIPARRSAAPYVRALAVRDLAVALALAWASRGPLASLASLAASLAVIPCGDAALVVSRTGPRAWPSLALHLASGMSLCGVAMACHSAAHRRARA